MSPCIGLFIYRHPRGCKCVTSYRTGMCGTYRLRQEPSELCGFRHNPCPLWASASALSDEEEELDDGMAKRKWRLPLGRSHIM